MLSAICQKWFWINRFQQLLEIFGTLVRIFILTVQSNPFLVMCPLQGLTRLSKVHCHWITPTVQDRLISASVTAAKVTLPGLTWRNTALLFMFYLVNRIPWKAKTNNDLCHKALTYIMNTRMNPCCTVISFLLQWTHTHTHWGGFWLSSLHTSSCHKC